MFLRKGMAPRLPAEPGLMSLTRAVPAEVPSLRHSSLPWLPSLAKKKSVPLTFRRLLGQEPAEAGLMSLTTTGAEEGEGGLRRSSARVEALAEESRVAVRVAM